MSRRKTSGAEHPDLGLPEQDAEPDYLLFASSADKEAVPERSAAERYRGAAAILEAKKFHHPLSQLSKHQLRYPHQQIRDYLKEERWHKDLEPLLRPFGAVADLWTSAFFGNEMDEDTYLAQAQAMLAGGTVATPSDSGRIGAGGAAPSAERSSEQWRVVADTRRFFHWELAFPEVFFNDDGSPKENPGFDAVIGNPPYVSPHKLSADIKEFLWSTYPSYVAKSYLLNCFLEKALHPAGEDGSVGMITSDTWRILKSAEALRAMVLNMSCVREILVLSSGVFHDVAVTPVVVILQKMHDAERHLVNRVRTSTGDLSGLVTECMQQGWMCDPHHTFDTLGRAALDVKKSIEEGTDPLDAALTFTNRPIDRIVYRLYDLTPEEIRIVDEQI